MAIPKHKLAVAVLVLNDKGMVLLVNHPTRGWEFPGGFVDIGESIESAAVREVKEETGIQIVLSKLFGIDHFVSSSTCVFLFKGEADDGKVLVSSESVEVGFFSIAEAESMILNEGHRMRLSRCFGNESSSFLNVV